jgi:hypothetical protein
MIETALSGLEVAARCGVATGVQIALIDANICVCSNVQNPAGTMARRSCNASQRSCDAPDWRQRRTHSLVRMEFPLSFLVLI